MSPAERWYRRALRAYPRAVRATYGDEIVSTALEACAGRGGVDPRELGALVRGGLRMHMRGVAGPTAGTAMRGGLALLAFPLALLLLAVALAGLSVIAFPPGPWSVGVAERGVGVLGGWWPLLALGGLVALAGLAAGRRSPAVAGALVVVAVLAADAWKLHPAWPEARRARKRGSTSRSCGSMPPARSPPLPPPGLPSRRCFPAHCWRRRSSRDTAHGAASHPGAGRRCGRARGSAGARASVRRFAGCAGAAASGGPARDGGARAC